MFNGSSSATVYLEYLDIHKLKHIEGTYTSTDIKMFNQINM